MKGYKMLIKTRMSDKHRKQFEREVEKATPKTWRLAHLLSRLAGRDEPIGETGPLYLSQATSLLEYEDLSLEMKEMLSVQ